MAETVTTGAGQEGLVRTKTPPTLIILVLVLAVALGVAGFLFSQATGRLSQARADISGMQTRIASLQGSVATLAGQLAAENAKVADIQGKLTTEQAKSADLQAQLAKSQSDLTASKAQVASLQADLAVANGAVTSLTADLSAANKRAAALQAGLDTAGADLARATADLTKVRDPRHFSSLTELEGWLARDDTNTNPAYAKLTGLDRVYLLQVKALCDGYLLSAYVDWDDQHLYYGLTADAGGILYAINPDTDAVMAGPAYTVAAHPLALP